ncbi:MAG: hypothetical protein SGILL_006073 [Bacillariaceae sp.]
MANGDVDAINERLNGLVNLLQVVGIDGVNPDALVEEQRRAGGGTAARGSSAAPQSNDTQILELIKKLQLAQADSPEILAALKSPELRALASLAAQKQQQGSQNAAAPEKPAKKATPALDDVMDDDDNYPKIGPGYSDDISVVSDMTTPTVMTRQHVAEEEQYGEVNGGPGALPPMSALGPAQPVRPSMGMINTHHHHHGKGGGGGKTKNMVGQVRPGQARRAIAKSGGAAAQRRLNYQMAMTKLQGVPEHGGASPKRVSPKEAFAPASPTPSQQTPMEFPSMANAGGGGSGGKNTKAGGKQKLSKKGKKTSLAAQEVTDLDFEGTEPVRAPPTSTGTATTATGTTISSTRKNTPTPVTPASDVDWGIGDSSGWTAFDTGNAGDGSGQDIFVDNDGFFPNDAFGSKDAFGQNPSTPTSSAKSSSRSPRPGKKSSSDRPSKNKSTSSSRSRRDGDKKDKEKSLKKKSRARSSLTM